MNDYSSPSTVDLCLLVVAKQVANITENSILRESNWPVLFAGGNTEFVGNVSIKSFLSESVVQEILNKNLLGYVSVSQISIDDEKKIKKSFMEIQIASLITIE